MCSQSATCRRLLYASLILSKSGERLSFFIIASIVTFSVFITNVLTEGSPLVRRVFSALHSYFVVLRRAQCLGHGKVSFVFTTTFILFPSSQISLGFSFSSCSFGILSEISISFRQNSVALSMLLRTKCQ